MKQKGHIIFWAIGIILIGLQLYFTLASPDSSLTLNVYDTYFVIASAHFFNVIGTWFILCGIGYWVLKLRNINAIRWMFWLHLILSVMVLMGAGASSIEVAPGLENMNMAIALEVFGFFSLVFFILAQLIYFLNVLISTLRKVKST